MNALAAATIIAFAATAHAAGNAIVTNLCGYDVLLDAVPAAYPGSPPEQDTTLGAGQTWSMPYTQLQTGGWSIKLSGDPSFSNILQYEYSWANDGTIWYDLSDVNGNPWDGNWEISSDNGNCVPRQAAYRYATDDAYGEQSCPDYASITVTLCSGENAPPAMAGSSLEPTPVVKAVVATPVAQATTFATQISTPAPAVVGMNANGAVEVAAKPKARRHSHHARHHA